jgi:hypothetical protein
MDDPEGGVGTDPLLDPDGVSWVETLPGGVLDVLDEDEGVGPDPVAEELVGEVAVEEEPVGVSPVLALP